MKRTPLFFLLFLTLLFLGLFLFDPSRAENKSSNEQDQKSDITVVASYQNDTSIPLRKMKPQPMGSKAEHEANENPKIPHRHKDSPDPVVQDRFDVLANIATPNMPSPILNFNGIPFPGVTCNCAPPDTNGEVGATQYVQIANEGFQVFNKTTGASQLGPSGISTLWSGFGGPCETAGSGDPVVLYDQLANRWLISQFAGATIPTDECIAVSTTSDATGSYHRYAFHLGSNFFDYPKLAVWPDGYYMAMNVFNSSATAFLGPQPFAFDRAKMLAGLPATFITTGITVGPLEDTYLPADLDGSILPPAGTPATFIEWPGTGTYRIFHFHVDFANPLSSTFTLFANPAAAGFTERTLDIPQLGTFWGLDPLGDRLMFRAATRFFPDGHESLVSNFTVQSGSTAAVRWFELRNPTQGPVTVFQQGTYQPDGTHRWMGSAAMDQQGNLAVGYSASSTAINPQIRYAGRLVSDPLNTLPQAEVTLFAGTGSQTNTTRWGDYSAMTVDPVDDCTFWYTQEYYATTSSFNWRTRIGSFKFPGCTGTVTRTLTVASANPSSGVSISVSPIDNGALGNGTTQFTRTYNNNTTVTLTAPATAGANNFQKWQRNGVDWAVTQATSVTLDAGYTMTAVYVPVVVTPGLVGYWKFDENAGTTAADSSGNGNTGTLTSGAGWGTGQSGSAVSLDGVNDYVQVGAQSSLVMSTTTTIAAWIHPTGPGSDPTFGGIIAGKEGEYVLARLPNGRIEWAFANSNPGWQLTDTGFVAPLNQWTHIAVTYDNGVIRTYANGSLVHTFNGSGSIGDANTGQNDFRIGGRQMQIITHYFQGRLDEVRLYNLALTANEVSALVGNANLGPIGYWKFDENSGTTAADSSGNNNTGTLMSGAGWTTGQFNAAVSLDGVDDFVKIKDGKISNSTTGTISAWVKASSLINGHKIVCYGGAAAAAVQGLFGLEIRQDGGNFYFSVINVPADGSPSANIVHGNTVLQAGIWYHVAVTSDGSSWKLYVNGAPETLTTQAGIGNTGRWFGNTSVAAPDKTYIGGARFNGTDVGSFPGAIDEVRIYDRALPASEIATLAGGLIGYWKFDENSGTTAADSSGNNNTGTLMSGAGWTTGQFNAAVSLDGVDDFVKIKDGKISNSTTGTISAWVKMSSLVNAHKIVCYGGAPAAAVQGLFGLEIRQDGSNYYFSVINVPLDGTPSADIVHGSTVLQAGVWYHVALTSNGSSWKLYVNGVAETLTTQAGSNTGRWFGNTSAAAPDKTYIGGARFNGADVGSFPGAIDEVRIYDRALSASEVAALAVP